MWFRNTCRALATASLLFACVEKNSPENDIVEDVQELDTSIAAIRFAMDEIFVYVRIGVSHSLGDSLILTIETHGVLYEQTLDSLVTGELVTVNQKLNSVLLAGEILELKLFDAENHQLLDTQVVSYPGNEPIPDIPKIPE